MNLEFPQYIYLALLLIGSGVAYFHNSRFVILIMWANVLATMYVGHSPLDLAFIDLGSAVILLYVVETKAAKTIAVIFCVMVFMYPLTDFFGPVTTYTIVDILASVQIFAMGSTGFGRGIRHINRRFVRVFTSSVSVQNHGLDTTPDDSVAVEKNARSRVKGPTIYPP